MTHALRPLSVGELLDRTFHFYRQHFLLFVGIAALPSLGMLGFGLLVDLVGRNVTSLLLRLLSTLMVLFLYLVTTAVSQGATVVAVSQILLGRETNVSQAFSQIWSRVGVLVLLIVNMGLRIGLGFVLLFVPGVLLLLMYALTMPIAVLEEKGVSESLSRSAALTKGHRGRIFVIYVLLFLLVTIVSMVWQAPLTLFLVLTSGAIQDGQLPVWAQVVFRFGSFVTQSILGPILTIAIALVYYDVRVRKEAFDLEHMMQQIDQTGLAPSPIA